MVHSGLTVHLGKTCWLVGGSLPRAFSPGDLFYRGCPLTRVSELTYLGLQFSGRSLDSMVSARIGAAHRAWALLLGFMV